MFASSWHNNDAKFAMGIKTLQRVLKKYLYTYLGETKLVWILVWKISMNTITVFKDISYNLLKIRINFLKKSLFWRSDILLERFLLYATYDVIGRRLI